MVAYREGKEEIEGKENETPSKSSLVSGFPSVISKSPYKILAALQE